MASFLPLIADRVLNVPLFLHPSKAEIVFGVLEGRISLDAVGPGAAMAPPVASRFVGTPNRKGRRQGLTMASGSTAIITIDGSLVNRGAWIGASSGITSYEGLEAQVADAAGDAEIRNVILDINSYGGEANGMFGLAQSIRSLRKSKRVVAVINDVAASAGYGIASAADEIVVSPTSLVGSIGVVMMHMDRSAEMSAKGVRATLIYAGAKKVDGHPFGPLPDDVRAAMQGDVAAFYSRFVDTVAAGRGRRLTAAQARATEADTFIGGAAIKAGLADRFATLGEILAELERPAQTAASTQKGQKMTYGNDSDTQAIIQTARLEERARIKAIFAAPEAKGRDEQARALAFDTDMSVAAASGFLATFPAAETKPKTPPLGQRGSAPEIGPSMPEGVSAGAAKSGWGKAVADANGAFGSKLGNSAK